MFSLTIVFGPGPMVWTLMYKQKETAVKAVNEIAQAIGRFTDVTDDFGQTAMLDKIEGNIHGFMLEDMEISKLAHIERALHQTRTKVKADELAMADPVIKSAAMRPHQSPLITPAMPGMPAQNGQWRG